MSNSSERPNLQSSVFWAIKPCNPLKGNRRFGEYITSIFSIEEEAKQEIIVKQVASSTTHSSEKSIDFQRTAWHYIPEDRRILRIPPLRRTSNSTSTSPFSRQSSSIYFIEDYEECLAEFHRIIPKSCGRPKPDPIVMLQPIHRKICSVVFKIFLIYPEASDTCTVF
jgi:hypothetical protein